MNNWLTGFLYGILFGISGYQLIQYNTTNKKIYSESDMEIRQTLSCSKGVIETIQFISLNQRDEPANCSYFKEKKND